MIAPLSISEQATILIQKKLREIEKEQNVRILFAIESGSRAWGFPSINSDYDVRFVYARQRDDYLSVRQYRDVIETELLHDNQLGVPLDLNGWDVRKALQLALTSNAVLLEWLQSPIRYIVDENAVASILGFAQEVADIQSINNHYFKLMMHTWEQIKQSIDAVKLKHYCYALRPALVLQWISQYGSVPPMDMHTLCTKLVSNQNLDQEISGLIAKKAISKESDAINCSPAIDALITLLLSNPPTTFKKLIDDEKIIKADKLFRKMI